MMVMLANINKQQKIFYRKNGEEIALISQLPTFLSRFFVLT